MGVWKTVKFKNNFLGIRLKGLKTFRHSPFSRLLHWVLVPSFFALATSGLFIHKPSRYVFKNMNSARKVHFMASYCFGFYFLSRVYYAVVTKGYRKLFPGKEDMADLPNFMSYELFFKNKEPKYPRYNPGQKLLFVQMAFVMVMQIITGAALYSSGKLQKLSRILGGLSNTRLIHYLSAVGLSSMAVVHLYFTLTDSVDKFKSIFTGYFKPK